MVNYNILEIPIDKLFWISITHGTMFWKIELKPLGK